jgi:hypothetical protein
MPGSFNPPPSVEGEVEQRDRERPGEKQPKDAEQGEAEADVLARELGIHR